MTDRFRDLIIDFEYMQKAALFPWLDEAFRKIVSKLFI